MKILRYSLLILSLTFGTALIVIFVSGKYDTPMKTSLSPAFILLGKPIGYTNHALTKLLPLNSTDEREYGDAIRHRYEQYKSNDKNSNYVSEILKHLTKNKKKKFQYTVFVLPELYFNAFALPGGVIFVTEGLLNSLKSESEVVGILAHEIGHIELSHSLDTVRLELLAKKAGVTPAGKLADLAVNILFRHSYSKTQEDAADEYAFKLLKVTSYTPSGIGAAFEVLLQKYPSRQNNADILKEYFMSHPHTKHRADKFRQRAKVWWKKNQNEKRYLGIRNLRERRSFFEIEFDDEWIN